MTEDPVDVLRRQIVPLNDREGVRLFVVVIVLPAMAKTMTVGIEVEDSHVGSHRIQQLAAIDGLDEDAVYKACAIDSVRIKLENAGIPRDELLNARVVGCQQVTAEILNRLGKTLKM